MSSKGKRKEKLLIKLPAVPEPLSCKLRSLGGVNAACCQLVRGFEVSPLNQHKLFDTDGEKVAAEMVRCLAGTEWRGEQELERLFFFVLAQSTNVRFSFAGKEPDEPWIAAFCAAAVKALLKMGMPKVADSVIRIAQKCLESVDQKKLAVVDEKAEATRKRKAAAKAAAAERYGSHIGGFDPHPLPESGSSVVTQAGYTFDDFDEVGVLLPDSDCDEDAEVQLKRKGEDAWHCKRERYCRLMDEKGHAMDLKGCDSTEVYRGKPLVVYYDESGDDRTANVPYQATVVEFGDDKYGKPALRVRFQNGDEIHLIDDDEWHWDDKQPSKRRPTKHQVHSRYSGSGGSGLVAVAREVSVLHSTVMSRGAYKNVPLPGQPLGGFSGTPPSMKTERM